MDQQQTAQILVIDDDPKVRLLLRRCFVQEGYGVHEAATGNETAAQLATNTISLVTLDLNLGQEDGLDIARAIRETSDVPIIMISGKGDVIDQVIGLELGADDYISKPFHLREVLARVRSVLRRSETARGERSNAVHPELDGFTFDGWFANFDKLELRRGDVPCEVTTGELRLLEILLKHPNKVLSRDRLMDLLKGHDWMPLDRSIDNQVSRLRKKIERDPKNPTLIKTVRGAGYKFTGDINME